MHDAGFHLISLRPVGGHDALRRAATGQGGRVMALSPWRIVERDDAQTLHQLRDALACTHIVLTSPAAVRAASRLQPLQARRGQRFLGVGEGTRRALQRAGITDVQAPTRMDSEGLLALPEVVALQPGNVVGFITAPGGRGEIAHQLQARGVVMVRVDVYERQPVVIAEAAWRGLRMLLDDATSPVYLALSSGDAFTELLAQLPPALSTSLHDVTLIAASERLAALAREHGFHRIRLAASARPNDLVSAINAT